MTAPPVRRQRERRQGGASLVLALLVVAVVAGLSASLIERQDRWHRQVRLEGDRLQAVALAEAAIDYGRAILADDERRGTLDHRGEAWALPLPPMNVEGGVIRGAIEDLQGRLNLNALLADARPLEALWSAQGLPREALDALADYLDADAEPRFPGGAEDQYYLGTARPYRSADAPLTVLDDALAVRGFDRAMLARLSGLVEAYPAAGPVNVNLAPVDVLMAVLPGIDRAQAERVRRIADAAPIRDMAELEAVLREGGWRGGPLPALGFSSRYFLIHGEVRWGEAALAMRVAVERMGAGAVPRILWKRLEPID